MNLEAIAEDRLPGGQRVLVTIAAHGDRTIEGPIASILKHSMKCHKVKLARVSGHGIGEINCDRAQRFDIHD